MSDELTQALAELRDLAPRLNRETDAAADAIKAVENFLDGLQLGVSAEAAFDGHTVFRDDDGTRTDAEYCLAYGRVNGTYRVHVVEKHCTTEYRDDAPPVRTEVVMSRTIWSSCPRETKLRSLAAIPTLLRRVAEGADRLATQASAATETANSLIAAMRSGATGNGTPAPCGLIPIRDRIKV